MKLRKALLVLTMGLVLIMPTTVMATDYDTTGPNDELSAEEIEALDTVEDAYNVDDYDYKSNSSSCNTGNSGGTEANTDGIEATTGDTPTYGDDTNTNAGDYDTSTETVAEDETSEDTEEEEEEVKTPKTGDPLFVYAAGLIIFILLFVYVVSRKEQCNGIRKD